MERKLRVLHITPDDKFFDGVYTAYENNEVFENKALFYAPKKDYQFRYIKRTDDLEIYYRKKDVKERLKRDDYDIVFLHSMPYAFYQFVACIPDNRKVIWWGWGYDIYEKLHGLPAIVDINLYKEKTQFFIDSLKYDFRTVALKILNFFFGRIMMSYQEEAIKRVDYYQPVVKAEIDLLRRNKLFRAKEFYYRTVTPVLCEYVERLADGDIILGNSATATNNHLDVLEVVLRLKQVDQKVIMPLSYGNDKYKAWLKPHLQKRDILPIYDFLPRDEYFQLVDKCSYAIYGNIRQQAMGNILHDIANGIKVFLYRDSIAYQNLISLGYVVFAIEDMSEMSLKTPLTKEQMNQNNKARMAEYNRRISVYHSFLKEMCEEEPYN